VVLAAVQENGKALIFASEELQNNKLFLIECYRINEDTIEFNDFIEQFDELEEGHFDDTFIEENVDILHFVENKEQLCQYLLDNEQYNIIYKNEEIAKYIKKLNYLLFDIIKILL
jgi:hypothetical protein